MEQKELNFQKNLCECLAVSATLFSKDYWTPAGTPVFCGDSPAPNTVESTLQMLEGYTQGLPGFLKVTREQAVPTAEASYELAQRFSPLYSQLQTQIYGEEGRILNEIGREIARENALAQASTDVEVLRGAGRELVREADAAQREVDPEYYATRELMSKGLAELLSGKLTGGEEEAMSRAIGRERVATGVNAPNALATASAASRFGDAAHNKLANALSLATGALPTMKTGVDVLMQTVGRPSQVNAGDSRFMGVTPEGYGNQAYQFGGNLLAQIGDNQRTAMNINANRRDVMDRLHQSTEMFKNVAGGVAGMMGGCYILLSATDCKLPSHTFDWMQPKLSGYTCLGYRKMAEWLVPTMVKSQMLKTAIYKLVARPFIKQSYNKASWLDKTLNKISLTVWNLYGRI